MKKDLQIYTDNMNSTSAEIEKILSIIKRCQLKKISFNKLNLNSAKKDRRATKRVCKVTSRLKAGVKSKKGINNRLLKNRVFLIT